LRPISRGTKTIFQRDVDTAPMDAEGTKAMVDRLYANPPAVVACIDAALSH